MESFLLGQIREEYRGNLVAIVTKGDDEDYKAFVYPFCSEELVYLTDVGSVDRPVVRNYVGVSKKAGKLVAKCVNYLNAGDISLKSIDLEIVTPHFLGSPLTHTE